MMTEADTRQSNQNLGSKIRDCRQQQNLSLRQLGTMTGLTAAFLSQVENDLTSPSINSLQKIATALHVPMFAFLNGDNQTEEVVRSGSRKKLNFPDPHLSYELLTDSVNRQMGGFLIRLKAGETHKTQALFRATEEMIYVMQGEVEIWLGDRKHHLYPGDSIYYEGIHLKGFTALGREDLLLLCAMTPPAL